MLALSDSTISISSDDTEFAIQPFAEIEELWESTIRAFPGALLYHGPRWLRLLRAVYKLRLSVATLTRSGEIRAACLLARSRNPLSARFVSLPFSDSCPPLADDVNEKFALLNALTRHRTTGGGYELRGVDAEAPWNTVHCFADWTLDLARPVSAIERGLNQHFRRQVRRALAAGVKVERGSTESFVDRFFALQLETRRRLGLPAQPLRFFRLAREIFAPANDFEVWLASHGGQDLAGAIHLREGERVYRKWIARRLAEPASAGHLLFWNEVETLANHSREFNLGRADVRNHGLSRFKKEAGATPQPLPYVFFPNAPREVSSEVLKGPRKLFATFWRHMPLAATRLIGGALYGYLA